MVVSWLPRGRAAKVMGIVMTAAVGAIYYSHYAQVRDKAVMRAGVERDKERLRNIRAQRRLAQSDVSPSSTQS
jgi:hypothetical protein